MKSSSSMDLKLIEENWFPFYYRGDAEVRKSMILAVEYRGKDHADLTVPGSTAELGTKYYFVSLFHLWSVRHQMYL